MHDRLPEGGTPSQRHARGALCLLFVLSHLCETGQHLAQRTSSCCEGSLPTISASVSPSASRARLDQTSSSDSPITTNPKRRDGFGCRPDRTPRNSSAHP